MTTQPTIDQAKTEAFLGKVLGDASGMTTTILATIGDRLGLFKQLAPAPATSAQLAARAEINERYAREWLGAMASAVYVEYDPESRRFTLPAEHIPVLAQEHGPFFFGGLHQMLAGMIEPLNQLILAFQHGRGVPQSAYGHNMWDGLERLTAGGFENLLIPVWLPAMPEVQDKLERGAVLADVGCGRGKALIKLAQAFPRSASSNEDLNEMLSRQNNNLASSSVTATQFLQERDIAIPERAQSASEQSVSAQAAKQGATVATWAKDVWEKHATMRTAQAVQQAATVATSSSLPESISTTGTLASLGMSVLEQKRLEIERGPGGDHDTPYLFTLPISMKE